ncbi:hypothetical protein DMJ13_27060 [halophilic archaeon]|nr:hypothetical protein DMJ13_27060 [halophilic archaeon]
MQVPERPPDELSERQLFKAYVEIKNNSAESLDGYEQATLQKQQAALLAEIGERLETFEAVKSLL